MARVVKHEETGPMQIEVAGEKKYICMCGLTKNKPFCDGSHKACQDEEHGKTYKYNEDGSRDEIN